MNSAKTLYSILNVIILILLAGIGLGIFFLAMPLFGVKQDSIGFDENTIGFKTEAMKYIYIILKFGVYGIFISALWRLRKVTLFLLKKDFYNYALLSALASSGKLMIIAAISSWCIVWISNIFFKFRFVIGLNEKTLVYLFVIAIGLFLMLVSTILKDAKALKEENDLTI